MPTSKISPAYSSNACTYPFSFICFIAVLAVLSHFTVWYCSSVTGHFAVDHRGDPSWYCHLPQYFLDGATLHRFVWYLPFLPTEKCCAVFGAEYTIDALWACLPDAVLQGWFGYAFQRMIHKKSLPIGKLFFYSFPCITSRNRMQLINKTAAIM